MASGDWRLLLRDKVVFVTGGAGWVGQHIVKLSYEHGARVVIGDNNTEGANKVKADIIEKSEKKDEDRLLVVPLDVTDEKSIEQAVKQTVDKWQSIDVLVNTAAIYPQGDLENVSSEQWTDVFNVNVRGYALTAKHIAPILKRNNGGGAIINIASIGGLVAVPCSVSYSATKGAVLQMTRNLALDLGQFNIRVNSISPGFIYSPMVDEIPEELDVIKAQFDAISLGKCLKRMCHVEEVANAVVFLASDLCCFMTGSNLILDGGYTCV